MKRTPWLTRRKKTDPELPLEPPIRLGNFSNGEFFHEQTPLERKIRKEVLQQADEKSRRLGIDRREFLASALGMATSLSVLNMAACSSDGSGGSGGAGGSGGSGGSAGSPGGGGPGGVGSGGAFGGAGGAPGTGGGPGGGGPGGSGSGGSGGSPSVMDGGTGGYNVPPDATMDCELAEDILDANDFIFDIQTHHIEREGEWRTRNPASGTTLASFFASQNGCALGMDPVECVDAQAYLEKIFLESQTSVAVLSGFPAPLCTPERTSGCGAAIDNDGMALSRDRMNAIARSQRVVNHCQIAPNDRLDLQLALMDRMADEYGVWGWKCYPEWAPDGGPGWALDDPTVGIPFIERARALDVKVICIHKGIVFPGWDANASHPRDVGVVANMFPDTHFIVYHSAIELGAAGEGPYNPNNTQGTDRLCRTAEDHGLYGKNMYAELGSVWAQVMNNPTMAEHVIGKLLKYLGPDNVLWGSECVWLGSPQPQIEAFRAFEISQQFQDQYGYPALTPEVKRKIFGLSSAAVYGLDPEAVRCRVKQTTLSRAKEFIDGELGSRRWAFQPMVGPRSRQEFRALAKSNRGRPG